jgi:hypothetical protein
MSDQKASYEAFFRAAITQLRDPTISRGIHVVYSGFNNALKQYYGKDIDPKEITGKLAREGKIAIRFVKGGAMIYLPEDYGTSTVNLPDKPSLEQVLASAKKRKLGDAKPKKSDEVLDLDKLLPAKKKSTDLINLERLKEMEGKSAIRAPLSDDRYEQLRRQMAIDYEIGRQRAAGPKEMHKKSPDIIYLRKKKRKAIKSKVKRKSVKRCRCK